MSNSNGIKILLAEDDSFLREICAKKLFNEGYEVIEAMDGEQALRGFVKNKIDIVLLDIIMPSV
ncbi:MAG: response regulator, partial [Candidatus Falkowbacteria bacterium]